ncbi:MAG: class I tRNA ligase family protein [Candidatus Saccharimonadales bacterium]
MKRYNPAEIEKKWQQQWESDGTYSVDFDSTKPKYIGFGMFNYPSGAGIHVGHVRNYTIPDVVTRAKRQQGFASYQPVGWDSFGLPAENFAIKTGVRPQVSTVQAIDKYHDQYRALGWAVDWRKEISTTDPKYYRWTQWTFTKLFERGLAYQQESPQWWCDQCKTVLADEQVIAGKCWRHDGTDDPLVTKKQLKQWFFKITDYADELLDATDALDWTPSVKASQKAWIGRSVGAEIEFDILPKSKIQNPKSTATAITVFTTRPDTLFGATFLVVAPEHPLVTQITTDEQRTAVDNYVEQTLRKSEIQRQQDADKEKTGVFTGAYAINPINNAQIPIWIADYVLMGYGTGAIMAVPGHDERDYAFAKKFDLPITQVIMPCEDDSFNPPQDKYEEVVRNTIIVHLRDVSSGRYALLDWHGTLKGITTAIMGGIEEGQSAEEAALMEIREEAGLSDVKIIKVSPWISAARYCASHKKQNRKAISWVCEAEVTNVDNQQPTDTYETTTHTLKWVEESEVMSSLTPDHQKYVWELLQTDSIFHGEGELINSGAFDGVSSAEARELIVQHLAREGKATEKINYKIRDWLISRQRYWGAPIPIVHCPTHGAVAVPEDQLPVELPLIDNYQPTGGNASVLAGVEEWVNTTCPTCGGPAARETDTMDGYVCSSWYFLRYLDPTNDQQAWDVKQLEHWMPIDFYNGGDHATAHLLYARFYTRFFHSLGLVPTPEPFTKMVFNGKVRAHDGSMFSKSKGNGIDPLEVIEQGYGADALRLYEMFAAPVELDVLWDPQGIPGTYRFISRVWNLVQEFVSSDPKSTIQNPQSTAIVRAVHQAIKKVTNDIEEHKFNTAIASLMELTNALYKAKPVSASDDWRFAVESLLQLLAPFAPHVSEELWHQLGHDDSIHVDHWPVWDEQYLTHDTMTLAVQVNGKVRAEISVATDASNDDIESAALAHERVQEYLGGKKPTRVIYVPGRLVNVVC